MNWRELGRTVSVSIAHIILESPVKGNCPVPFSVGTGGLFLVVGDVGFEAFDSV